MTFKEELEILLKAQLDILKELNGVVSEKTNVLVDDDIKMLEKMTKKEEELIHVVGNLEIKREELLDSWGIDKNTSLSTLIDNVPEEDKKDLENLGLELFNILKEIDEKNELNNNLLRDDIEWIEFNLNLLGNVQTPSTYGQKDKGVKTSNSIFDKKV